MMTSSAHHRGFTRRTVRTVGAITAAVMAAIYFLIGIGVLRVGTTADGSADAGFMLVFGLSAGSAFLLGAVLLTMTDRRVLWVLGVVLQVLVYIGYFSVAPQRTPPYELWGLTLRAVQVPLLVALLFLSLSRADVPSRSLLVRRVPRVA